MDTSIASAWAPPAALLALASALVVAAITDMRRREIDNWLTGGLALAAPLGWWLGGLDAAAIGARVLVAILAFALLAALFAMRALGGGDVKLLAALALWFDPAGYARLLVLAALLGGPLALACLARHAFVAGGRAGPIAVPYGVAIAGAGLCVLAAPFSPATVAAVPW